LLHRLDLQPARRHVASSLWGHFYISVKLRRGLRGSGLGGSSLRSLGSLLEQHLVVLLGLEEGVLEEVGVWTGLARGLEHGLCGGDLLSALAKRIAKVTASGSPSLTSAAAFQTQERSEPTLGDSFISGTTGEGQRGYMMRQKAVIL
jgi:hypothetical protein